MVHGKDFCLYIANNHGFINYIEKQDGYQYLDSKPATLTGKAHRPAYGTDGDYFSKPSTEDIFEKVYEIMHEVYPERFKSIY